MRKIANFQPIGHRSGNWTEWLVKEAYNAIAEGQPKVVLVGSSQEQCQYMKEVFVELLDRFFRGESIHYTSHSPVVRVDESEIHFVSQDSNPQWSMGHRGFGVFMDCSVRDSLLEVS